jgi:hypothetical protein
MEQVKLWDASSGTCLQIFDVGKTSSIISFGSTDSFLYPEKGTIAIDVPHILDLTMTAEPVPHLYVGTSLGLDNT